MTALSFYALERCGGAILASAVPEAQAPGVPLAVVITAVVSTFALVTLLQLLSAARVRVARLGCG